MKEEFFLQDNETGRCRGGGLTLQDSLFCPNYGNCRIFKGQGKILLFIAAGVLKEAFDLNFCRMQSEFLQIMARIHAVPNYGTCKTVSSTMRNNCKKSLNNGKMCVLRMGKVETAD